MGRYKNIITPYLLKLHCLFFAWLSQAKNSSLILVNILYSFASRFLCFKPHEGKTMSVLRRVDSLVPTTASDPWKMLTEYSLNEILLFQTAFRSGICGRYRAYRQLLLNVSSRADITN